MPTTHRPSRRTPCLILSCVAMMLALAAGPRAVSQGVVISQVYGGGGEVGAAYTNDFVELFNHGSSPVSLAGWSIQYASASGGGLFGAADILITPLPDVTLAPGQYLLVEASSASTLYGASLPAPDAADPTPLPLGVAGGKVALVSDAAPLGCNGGSRACTASQLARVVDLVGYGPANFAEGAAPAPSPSAALAVVRKNAGCAETDSNGADFALGPPAPRNSSSAFHTCAPSTPIVAIHDIQGAGDVSPLVGERVTARGVVTGVLAGSGFFMQTPDADADTNPLTSEGIFVDAPAGSAPSVGELVAVTGTVQELRTVTSLSGDLSVATVTRGNAPPAPTLFAPPTDGGAALEWRERLEGMRAWIPNLTVVGPTGGRVTDTGTVVSDGSFVGVLAGTPRPYREAGVPVTVTLPPGAPEGIPRFDENLERILVSSLALVGGRALDVAAGDALGGLVGPFDLVDGVSSLLLDPSAAPSLLAERAQAASTAPRPDADFTVAALDLGAFYDDVDDPGADLVLPSDVWSGRLEKASVAVRVALGAPDILAVSGVENLKTLRAIAATIGADAASAGDTDPKYEALLVEGHDPSLLDLGFLVKRASGRVAVVDLTPVGSSATYLDADSGATEWLNDRPPLALRARVADARGGSPLALTVIAAHIRSSESIDTVPHVREQRRLQAEQLAGEVQRRQLAGERVVLVGNLNAGPNSDGYVDVIGTLTGNPTHDPVLLPSADLVEPNLSNLADLLPAGDRYSCVDQGNAEQFDHVLVSATLLPRVAGFSLARLGADFPAIWANEPARPERLSNHDVPVASFSFPSADLKVVQGQTPNPVSAGGRITYTVTIENGAAEAALGVRLQDTLPAGSTLAHLEAPPGWSCVSVSDGLACATPELPARSAASFTIVAEVGCSLADGSSLANQAAIDSATYDPDLTNNQATLVSSVSNLPPWISGAEAAPLTLWPVNHKMVPVAIRYTAHDACDPNPRCSLSVSSSERADGVGDGRSAVDWQVVGDHEVQLRAERSGGGAGRIYTIGIACSDSGGAVTRQSVTVLVPRDQSSPRGTKDDERRAAASRNGERRNR